MMATHPVRAFLAAIDPSVAFDLLMVLRHHAGTALAAANLIRRGDRVVRHSWPPRWPPLTRLDTALVPPAPKRKGRGRWACPLLATLRKHAGESRRGWACVTYRGSR